ncbi:MAG: hypothetical protein LJE61_09365 [Thiocapsa sp.]|nr:hypothetical protein [Thiocapsa sp.]MCG6985389.1 hypothetical protein [Thiocapsa sp.]
MPSSSIEQIDRAAQTLLQALSEHGAALAVHLEAGHLETLKAELTTLRQALLGLEMGPLYWDAAGDAEEDSGGVKEPGP